MQHSPCNSPSIAVFPADPQFDFIVSCPMLSSIVSQLFPTRNLVFKFVIAKIMLQR